MKVFRLLGEDELKMILENRVDELGAHFARENGNTHKYKRNQKYIHFFFHKEDCEYIKKIQNETSSSNQNFIAEFNIPLKRIIGHIGKGFYEARKGGYDSYYDVCYELAIPTSLFNPSWLKGYEKISLKKDIIVDSKQPS